MQPLQYSLYLKTEKSSGADFFMQVLMFQRGRGGGSVKHTNITAPAGSCEENSSDSQMLSQFKMCGGT